jgi:hypothetical protein
VLRPALTLLTNQTANGNGPAVSGNLGTNALRHAPVTLYALGVFGGATIKVQASPDGQNWVEVPSLSITAPTVINLDVSASMLRAVVSGASGTTSVSLIGI